MSSRLCLLLGSTAFLAGAATAPASADEHWTTERLNQQQLEYRVMPRPSPHRVVWVRRWVWDDFWGDYHLQWVPRYSSYRNVSYTRSSHRTRMAAAVSSDEDSARP